MCLRLALFNCYGLPPVRNEDTEVETMRCRAAVASSTCNTIGWPIDACGRIYIWTLVVLPYLEMILIGCLHVIRHREFDCTSLQSCTARTYSIHNKIIQFSNDEATSFFAQRATS